MMKDNHNHADDADYLANYNHVGNILLAVDLSPCGLTPDGADADAADDYEPHLDADHGDHIDRALLDARLKT